MKRIIFFIITLALSLSVTSCNYFKYKKCNDQEYIKRFEYDPVFKSIIKTSQFKLLAKKYHKDKVYPKSNLGKVDKDDIERLLIGTWQRDRKGEKPAKEEGVALEKMIFSKTDMSGYMWHWHYIYKDLQKNEIMWHVMYGNKEQDWHIQISTKKEFIMNQPLEMGARIEKINSTILILKERNKKIVYKKM